LATWSETKFPNKVVLLFPYPISASKSNVEDNLITSILSVVLFLTRIIPKESKTSGVGSIVQLLLEYF
jgi:hypothetical protein